MDAWFELKERCARRESQALGGLSPNAYHELEQAINNNPTDYVKTNDEKALLILARALDRVMQERKMTTCLMMPHLNKNMNVG